MPYKSALSSWADTRPRTVFAGAFLTEFVHGLTNFVGIQMDRKQVQLIMDTDEVYAYSGSIRDILSVANNKRVARYINKQMQYADGLTPEFLCSVNRLLMSGALPPRLAVDQNEKAGEYRHGQCEGHIRLPGSDVANIDVDVQVLCQNVDMRGDPITEAAKFACNYARIMPFPDGNMRTCVWAVNYILLCAGHPPVVADTEMEGYILEAHKKGDTKAIEELLRSLTVDSLKYWR